MADEIIGFKVTIEVECPNMVEQSIIDGDYDGDMEKALLDIADGVNGIFGICDFDTMRLLSVKKVEKPEWCGPEWAMK